VLDARNVLLEPHEAKVCIFPHLWSFIAYFLPTFSIFYEFSKMEGFPVKPCSLFVLRCQRYLTHVEQLKTHETQHACNLYNVAHLQVVKATNAKARKVVT
jgi:hypothetical protein